MSNKSFVVNIHVDCVNPTSCFMMCTGPLFIVYNCLQWHNAA